VHSTQEEDVANRKHPTAIMASSQLLKKEKIVRELTKNTLQLLTND